MNGIRIRFATKPATYREARTGSLPRSRGEREASPRHRRSHRRSTQLAITSTSLEHRHRIEEAHPDHSGRAGCRPRRASRNRDRARCVRGKQGMRCRWEHRRRRDRTDSASPPRLSRQPPRSSGRPERAASTAVTRAATEAGSPLALRAASGSRLFAIPASARRGRRPACRDQAARTCRPEAATTWAMPAPIWLGADDEDVLEPTGALPYPSRMRIRRARRRMPRRSRADLRTNMAGRISKRVSRPRARRHGNRLVALGAASQAVARRPNDVRGRRRRAASGFLARLAPTATCQAAAVSTRSTSTPIAGRQESGRRSRARGEERLAKTYDEVSLWTLEDNERAHRFYERAAGGWVPAGDQQSNTWATRRRR